MIRVVASSVEVDGDWYLAQNPDVDEAVRAGTFASAQEHFVACGFREGRQPRPIPVDEVFYLAGNPDVAEAVSRGDVTSAQQHFDEAGYREGRLPSDGFLLF